MALCAVRHIQTLPHVQRALGDRVGVAMPGLEQAQLTSTASMCSCVILPSLGTLGWWT